MVQYITSSVFRAPIKEFVEEHCYSFDGTEENTFEQTDLHQVYFHTKIIYLPEI